MTRKCVSAADVSASEAKFLTGTLRITSLKDTKRFGEVMLDTKKVCCSPTDAVALPS